MKKIIMIIVSVLFFSSVSSVSANGQQLAKEEVIVNTQTFKYPINSIETGEEVGMETIQNETIRTVNIHGVTETVLNTIITSKFYDSKDVEIDKNSITFTHKNGKLEYIDGIKSELPADEVFSLTPQELKLLKPLADKFNNGTISYDEYKDEIKKSEIIAKGSMEGINEQVLRPLGTSGGVPNITHYSKSSRGGYFLDSGKIKGYVAGGLESFGLDPRAAVANSVITKHNYLVSDQGGLVSSFMNRADQIASARVEIAIEMTALLVSLGVAVITVPTIIATAAGIGATVAAAAIAARMVSMSTGGHNNIEKAYEINQSIRNQ